MHRRGFLHKAMLAAPASLLLTREASAQLAGGIDELARETGYALGIPNPSAVAGVGALMHVAREKLPSLEFTVVARFLPGAERMIFQAANVIAGELPKSIDGMPGVMQKIQLPAETSDRIRSFILDYLERNGGRKVVALLRKAWKA